MKKTQWFPVQIAPVRPGYYEIKYAGHPPVLRGMEKMFFDGIVWRFGPNADKSIFGNVCVFDATDGDQWRGMVADDVKRAEVVT